MALHWMEFYKKGMYESEIGNILKAAKFHPNQEEIAWNFNAEE